MHANPIQLFDPDSSTFTYILASDRPDSGPFICMTLSGRRLALRLPLRLA
jgi:hypothetical protein